MNKLIALILLLCSAAALAANFNYRVEINGLGDGLNDVLLKQLDIEAWHDSAEMNLDQLQRLHNQAPAQLQDLLATDGYFSARIEPHLEQDDGVWVARYDIAPGEPAVVDQLNLQFEGALSQTDAEHSKRRQQLQALWPLPVGSPFTQTLWREGKKRLLENLSGEDYPYASLKQSSATVSDDGQHIHLELVFDSGPAVKIGELVIAGLVNYPEKTVRNLNSIPKGSPYRREELLNFQSRIVASGYFSGVLVRLQPRETQADIADLQVQVTELKKKQIRIGVGFSTDTKARGQIGYENRNILDRGWRWNVRLQADQVKQSLSNEITFPSDTQRHQDSMGHSVEHSDLGSAIGETYDNRIYGKRHWGDNTFERAVTIELIDEFRKTIINNPPAPQQSSKKQIVTANLGYSWIQRDVDDLVFPSKGQIIDAQGLIGTQFKLNPYYRLYGRWNRYQPVTDKVLFLSRVEIGQIFGTPEDPPADYLFLGGGDNSVRGYPFHSLGHQNGSTTLGSASMGVFSGELQYWVEPRWGGAVFFDAGSFGTQFLRDAWYQGYGLGLRWRSPVGPLNIDYAWGQKVHDYQIHFSLGLAF